MFDSVYSIALDILGKIGGDTSKRYLSTYDIALAILGVLGGDTTKKFDSVYSILLDIYQARFGSTLSGMDSNYSILEEINKSFDPSDTTHYDSSYSILVSIDGQPGLIGHVFSIDTDAANTVIINGVETRSVSVREGENVVWSVERRGYVSQNGTYTMGNEDYTETVTLVKDQFTFSIAAIPADATVTINGEVRSSITAEFETVITWSVVREGYTSQSGTYTLVENHSETVSLVINQYTFSIVASPADATVVINGQERTSITADYGTSISWEVSKEGYTTQSNTETLTGDTTRNVTLVEVQYVFTIVPTPADATVMINGVQQSSVTVSDGTTLTWEVSKTGYETQTGSYTIDGADHTENVTLTSTQAVITFNKGNSAVKLVVNGEYLGTSSSTHTVTVNPGTPIHWEAYRAGSNAGNKSSGYATKKGTLVADVSQAVNVSLSTAKFIDGYMNYNGTAGWSIYNTAMGTYDALTINYGTYSGGLKRVYSTESPLIQGYTYQTTFQKSGDASSMTDIRLEGIVNNISLTNGVVSMTNIADNPDYLSLDSCRATSMTSILVGGSSTPMYVYLNNWAPSSITNLQSALGYNNNEARINARMNASINATTPKTIADYPQRLKELHMNCWESIPTPALFTNGATSYTGSALMIFNVLSGLATQSGYGGFNGNKDHVYNLMKSAEVDVYAYGWSNENLTKLMNTFKIQSVCASYRYYNGEYDMSGAGVIRIHINDHQYYEWKLETEYPSVSSFTFNTSSTGTKYYYNCTQWKLITIPTNKLKFNVVTGGDITWNAKTDVDASKLTIKYSKNGGDWNDITAAYGTPATISVNAGDVVEFYGFNSSYGDGTDGAFFGSANGATFSVSGDISSLIDNNAIVNGVLPDNAFRGLFDGCTGLVSGTDKMTFGSDVTGMGEASCRYMFNGCTGLTTIPFDSLDYTLGASCFRDMFKNCTNLAETPVLPQTTLADSCYYGMLYGCSSITVAPELPATTLEASCYREMLRGTSITTAPALPATTLASYCYQSMFNSCYDMTTGPASLPATTLASYCYAYMFENCQSMTTTPTMPVVTNIPTYAYRAMFKNCYRITSAPVLNVQSIATYGCYGMFQGCTSLTSVTGTLNAIANYAYQYMFDGCTNITTVPEITCTWNVSGTASNGAFVRMFQNCSSLQRIVCMTATGGGNPFSYWVSGVAATGTFVKNGTVRWGTGTNYCPSGWDQEFEHYNFTGTATSSPTLYLNRTSDSSGGTGMDAIEYDTDTKQFKTRIPTTVTSLRGMAYGNSALTSIDMSDGYPLAYIDQSMFYNCSNLTSVVLPGDITSVKTSAFGNCAALTSIEFPASVNDIAYDSLFGCTGLTSITVNATTPPKLASSFPYVNATIYVPAGSVNAYKTATGDYVGWSIMASQIQPIP